MTPQEIGAKAKALMQAGHLDREEVLLIRDWTRNPEYPLEVTAKVLDDTAAAAGFTFQQGVAIKPFIPRQQ